MPLLIRPCAIPEEANANLAWLFDGIAGRPFVEIKMCRYLSA